VFTLIPGVIHVEIFVAKVSAMTGFPTSPCDAVTVIIPRKLHSSADSGGERAYHNFHVGFASQPVIVWI
jgi:hypothetical protein